MYSFHKKRADPIFLMYIITLLFFGFLMLSSASAAVGYAQFGDSYFFIKRQLLYGILPGILIFFILLKVPYQFLKKLSVPIFLFSLIFLVVVFIPGIGSDLGTGAQSWIVFYGYSFQPSEFAKLGLIFFLAIYLSKKSVGLNQFSTGFLPPFLIGMLPVILVTLQPDIGTVSILFCILFGTLFLGGVSWKYMTALAILGVLGLTLMVVVAPYRAARLTTFLHPELDPQGIGYHINQASLAIGSGGVFGLGFSQSRQKFQYLPEVHADSIFAVIAEEMGLLFAGGLVLLIFLIMQRILRIARRAPDQFGTLLAGGIMVWFFSQSFLNIGAMVGILPLTGVPLPFVSHGGTALMVAMAGVGVVSNISKKGKDV